MSTVQAAVQFIDKSLDEIKYRNLISANEASDILLDLRQMVKDIENGKID